MKTFTEMAIETGLHNKSSFSKEDDWEFYNKTPDSVDLVAFNVGSGRFKIWKSEHTFFLTSDSEEYIGSLQTREYNNILYIETSHTKLKKGFYNIMFTFLLTMYKEIRSDTSLSTNAIKAYERLDKNTKLNVQVYDNGYNPYSHKALTSSRTATVSITEVYAMNEIINDYYDRIMSEKKDSFGIEQNGYRKAYENKSKELDMFLFGEEIEWK